MSEQEGQPRRHRFLLMYQKSSDGSYIEVEQCDVLMSIRDARKLARFIGAIAIQHPRWAFDCHPVPDDEPHEPVNLPSSPPV